MGRRTRIDQNAQIGIERFVLLLLARGPLSGGPQKLTMLFVSLRFRGLAFRALKDAKSRGVPAPAAKSNGANEGGEGGASSSKDKGKGNAAVVPMALDYDEGEEQNGNGAAGQEEQEQENGGPGVTKLVDDRAGEDNDEAYGEEDEEEDIMEDEDEEEEEEEENNEEEEEEGRGLEEDVVPGDASEEDV